MESEILKHYKTGFSSSPVEIEPEDLKILIEKKCECYQCGKSIFEMYDFPNFRDNEVWCEDCYEENFKTICAYCEDYYDLEDQGEHIYIADNIAKETGIGPGIFKVLSKPFFYGDIVFGFDGFFEGSLKKVVNINLDKYKKVECGEHCQEVENNYLCPDCEYKFIKKDNFLKIDGTPCILSKRYEGEYLKQYGAENLRKIRQNTIHKRITEI